MFLSHAGAQFYTVSFGNSPRTIVAHGGWAGSWEVWTETFTYLSETWRTVAYDHRGTGATIAPPESITFATMVADLFAILDALAIERCVLAAESAGAAIALQAALTRPERFQGLVLVDGLYYQPPNEGPDPFLRGLRSDFAATIGAFVDACVPEPDSAAVRRWGRQILARSGAEAAARLYEAMQGVDLRPYASSIVQPTLLLHGDADRVAPLSAAEWLASQIPRSHLHVIAGAGHVPTVTRPRVVAEAINRFFAFGA